MVETAPPEMRYRDVEDKRRPGPKAYEAGAISGTEDWRGKLAAGAAGAAGCQQGEVWEQLAKRRLDLNKEEAGNDIGGCVRKVGCRTARPETRKIETSVG